MIISYFYTFNNSNRYRKILQNVFLFSRMVLKSKKSKEEIPITGIEDGDTALSIKLRVQVRITLSLSFCPLTPFFPFCPFNPSSNHRNGRDTAHRIKLIVKVVIYPPRHEHLIL